MSDDADDSCCDEQVVTVTAPETARDDSATGSECNQRAGSRSNVADSEQLTEGEVGSSYEKGSARSLLECRQHGLVDGAQLQEEDVLPIEESEEASEEPFDGALQLVSGWASD
eukprot:1139661-Pleurochrysis_carterae.AAC.3